MSLLNRVGIGTGGAKGLSVKRLHRAYDLGMNLVDTAENYGTEKIVGESVADRRSSVFITTKVGPAYLRKLSLLSSAIESLDIMGLTYLDCLLVHWQNPAISLHETCEGLAEVLKRGIAAEVGLCNVTLTELIAYRALLPEISVVQNEYNVFDRTIEDNGILGYCFSNNIKFFAYSPLDGGHFGGKFRKAELQNIADTHDIELSGMCLQYLMRIPPVYVLPRISTIKRLRGLAKSKPLSLNVVADIDKKSRAEPIKLLPSDIDLRLSPYQTMQEAIHNPMRRCPEPLDMAKGELHLKPLKVRREGTTYVLVEGFMRYWAHVIALSETPVGVLVRE